MSERDPQGAGAEEPLLAVRDFSTHFPLGKSVFGREQGVVKAVDGVDFELHRGEVLGLVGESGSGKTTLGRALLKLVEPTAGELRYQGRDLMPLSEKEMRPLRRELSMIFQDPNASMNPAMTIAQGVGHPLWIHGMVETQAEARDRVAQMLQRVGLEPARNYLDRYPEELSGGQKQRLVIARALITGPKFVVADEPVAALDMSVRAQMLELMLELQRELDLTYIFITHDLATARFMCDRIGILYLGGFVEYGDADRMFEDPKHPYTSALLSAIPQPEAGRRNRPKNLPRGEIPDAARPPAGCRFHPRCPAAFDACGWEGQDLVDALEDRWTDVEPATYQYETKLFGNLADAEVARESVRFRTRRPDRLAEWLRTNGPELPGNVFAAVTAVTADSDSVTVRFGPGPEPAMQEVDDRQTACHLYGVVPRTGGAHVGDVG